jgi:5'(3')-deoxyribonucleotidase
MKTEYKPIIYIDMDGVIADFKRFVITYSDITEEDFINAGPIVENRVDDFCLQNPRVFRDLKPIENSIEVIKYLFDYFDIYFLSTPLYSLPESYMDKRIWLEKHFGDKAKKKLILTHRKDLCIGDCLIDDRKVNGAASFNGDFYHFSGIYANWLNVRSFLLQKLSVNYEFK